MEQTHSTTSLQEMSDSEKRPRMENFFSQLPRDCNLSVFRLVNRRTLNELEFVSKEVAHIVSDPSLSRLKTRGSLYIKELPDGSRNFQFCSRYPYRICYDIEQGKDEGTRSMRDNSSFRAPACARRFYPETFVPHPIPSHMLDSLADLGKTHGFNAIALHGFLVDNRFLDTCLPLLSGTRHLQFRDAHIDESLDLRKFSNFLLSANLNELELSHIGLPVEGSGFLEVFNQQFLTEFAANCADEQLNFSLYASEHKDDFHWVATREFLPTFNRFESFEMVYMRLQPEHAVEFILMRLAAYTAETYGYCYMREYSLTNEITEEHLDKLDSTKYDWDNDDGTTIIMDIDTIRSCTFTQSVKRNQLRIEMNFRGPLPAESGSEPGSGDEERVQAPAVA